MSAGGWDQPDGSPCMYVHAQRPLADPTSEPEVRLVVDHVAVEGLPEGHEPRPVQMALVPDEFRLVGEADSDYSQISLMDHRIMVQFGYT